MREKKQVCKRCRRSFEPVYVVNQYCMDCYMIKKLSDRAQKAKERYERDQAGGSGSSSSKKK